MTHPELENEREYVRTAYLRLQDLRAKARAMMGDVLDLGRGGTFQARAERDVVVRSSLARLEALDIGDQALCFGRIDFDEGKHEAGWGAGKFYIGRLSVASAEMDPLVVDWRAPVAEAFYRATGLDPMGLSRRRHFECRASEVLGIEDEILSEESASQQTTDSDIPPLAGPGALFAAITRPRSAHMRDIVSTIQGEQDAIIRHSLSGLLVVQGGPGTGKTAVALHRAAYLLYTYRWRLERQGLLLLGPNKGFLSYIQHVLPSLGENGVELATMEGICGKPRARAENNLEVASLKGDIRMAKLLRKAVSDRERSLSREMEIPFGSKYLKVTPELSTAAVSFGRKRSGTHNSKRRFVEAYLSKALSRAYLEGGPLVRAEDASNNIVRLAGLEEEQVAISHPGEEQAQVEREVAASIRRSPYFQKVLERIWPRLTPEQLIHDLYRHPALIRLASKKIFDDEECMLLAIPPSISLEDFVWSKEDAILLDEAYTLLGPAVTTDEEFRTFGHVIVDEAQDLSPMAARVLWRRCPSGSMTLLGDLAQAMGPTNGRDWVQITDPLRRGRQFELVELSVNYRTPAEISELAEQVRSRYLPNLVPARSIRHGASDIRFEVCGDVGELSAKVSSRIDEELIHLADGLVGVVCPTAFATELVQSALSGSARQELSKKLFVFDIDEARGLEFDSVIIVEPTQLILGDEARSTRALYVALTRSTGRLNLLSSRGLPEWLVSSGLLDMVS